MKTPTQKVRIERLEADAKKARRELAAARKETRRLAETIDELSEQQDNIVRLMVACNAQLRIAMHPGQLTFEMALKESHDATLQMIKEMEERPKL